MLRDTAEPEKLQKAARGSMPFKSLPPNLLHFSAVGFPPSPWTKPTAMNPFITAKFRLHARLILAVLAILLVSCPQIAKSEDAPPPAENAQTTDADQDANTRQALSKAFSQIDVLEATLAKLKAARAHLKGVRLEMVNARISRALDELISASQSAAKIYIDKAAGRPGFDDQRAHLVKIIESIPAIVTDEIERIRTNIKLPRPEQTPLEQAALGADVAEAADRDDKLAQALIANNEIAKQLDLDITTVQAAVSRHLARSAENASAYLDVTQADLKKLRQQLATLPKNKDLTERIAVTERNMLRAAEILRRRAARMESLGMDASQYSAQLIEATRSLSTKIFDLSVMQGLATNFFNSIVDWIQDNAARIIFQSLVFLLLLTIAWKVAHLVELIMKRAMGAARVHLSQLLQRMIVSIARSIVLVLGILIALSQLGVSLGPLLTGLGIAGFIVGFALQDSLSNFASGLMILIYRPFDVGDTVDVNGAFGTVRHMSLVNTTVRTYDNQTLIVPNNKVWQNVIKNLTDQTIRRVDMTFGISYGDDVEKAERVLHDIVSSWDKTLKEPEPMIHLHELGDSSVNFIVRPWVKTEDYWDTYWYVTRQVKLRFDAEGITIPFPQRDLHLHTPPPADAS